MFLLPDTWSAQPRGCESQERIWAADGSGQPSEHRVSQEAEANVWSTRSREEAQ